MDMGDDNMFGYLGHRLGNKGMTSDPIKIAPGMVYIDLDSKSRRGIYNANKKGASLIISNKNVSNPSIPIVQVKDIEETYLTLLNLLYERPIDKVSIVAVYGGSKGQLVVRLLDEIFANHFSKPNERKELKDFAYALVSEKFNSIAEKFFYYVLLCLSNDMTTIPFSYSDELKRFQSLLRPRYDCYILIDESPIKNKGMYCFTPGKPLFINIDDPHILKAIDGEFENIAITYGLNKKAAVTATSIEYGEITKFNYCLQRTFYSKSGSIIEPFEVPISIKGLGIGKVYSALSAISCALYYDIDMECVKETLYQFDDKGRDFSIIKYDNFILIDSYCLTERDYREAFEMLQMLDYRSLYVIIPDFSSYRKEFNQLLVDLINEWNLSLDIKELYILCGEKQEVQDKNLGIFKNVKVRYFDQLSKAIGCSIKYLSDKDVLLILGGDEMNSSQSIIELMSAK